MQLSFNQKKTTQAAARFLRLANGRMNYMKLLKLLYLTDRGALLRWGRPVSGDKYFLMKLGPVLSEVHDLITEVPCPSDENFWTKYISPPSNYEVELKADPGNEELSRAEERLIDEIFAGCLLRVYAGWQVVVQFHLVTKCWNVAWRIKSQSGHFVEFLRVQAP